MLEFAFYPKEIDGYDDSSVNCTLFHFLGSDKVISLLAVEQSMVI